MELNQFIFPQGVERVVYNQSFCKSTHDLLNRFGYRRAFIVCSRSINTRTELIQKLRSELGELVVGLTDDVGEHDPIANILAAAEKVRKCSADVLISVGGGSVLDFCKFVQLAVSEKAFTQEDLLRYQWQMSPDGLESLSTSTAEPMIRQIAIPTTLATAEWTSGGTPVDSITRQKARLKAERGAPRAIVYDPDVLRHTPSRLLFATAIRGLDHAINTYTAVVPHPLSDLASLEAIRLFFQHLSTLAKERESRVALSGVQLATWYTGMVQTTMSLVHGFSHWMTHILAPLALASHSETGGVLMLVQARWIEEIGCSRHKVILQAIGSSHDRLPSALEELLVMLELPTTLSELGITREHIEAAIPIAMQHPILTRYNPREITGPDDLRRLLDLGG
jgi:maleylacetate reductase